MPLGLRTEHVYLLKYSNFSVVVVSVQLEVSANVASSPITLIMHFIIICYDSQGGDLDDKIKAWKKAGKRFDESLILAWFIQLVLAVKFMHEK